MSGSAPNTANALAALKQFTVVVADSGDFQAIRAHQPQDATTNPSLIVRALEQPQYVALLQQVQRTYRDHSITDRAREVLVAFGREILKVIPGRVSTEVDARLAFDTDATVAEAEAIIRAYQAHGCDASRILIKVAATWEGIRAVRRLEQSGIACNVTLIFHPIQAAAAADAGATLISPFVGRITDWYKKQGRVWDRPQDDPGVQSVAVIYQYLKRHGYSTQVMGASFRTVEQVLALAGCDLLTVSPELLQQLGSMPLPPDFVRRLDPAMTAATSAETFELTEQNFRFTLNEDPMASDKLADGIRLFVQAGRELDARLV
jgi:transaldolase